MSRISDHLTVPGKHTIANHSNKNMAVFEKNGSFPSLSSGVNESGDVDRGTASVYVNKQTDETFIDLPDEREGWDNKWQFYAGALSYAIGLGNVWRFPYLCQKNGGGAFLIPYALMMVLEGAPLFLIELGIGQKFRTGPVGVWNSIHPYLGGVGVSATIVSFFVSLYYNVIITWCLYYLFRSFTFVLPWSECPVENGIVVEECAKSTSTPGYFWNRVAMNASGSLDEVGNFVPHLTICLFIAWFVVYLCVMRGIKSSGKVMYVTASFPYLITFIFLLRALSLPGAIDGLKYLLTPDLSRLMHPDVWLDAASQIFYSMGLGFGGLIAFGSYNPVKNNCKRDCIKLSIINILTSKYTAILVFCVMGFMSETTYKKCIENDMAKLISLYPDQFLSLDAFKQNVSIDVYKEWMEDKFQHTPFPLMANSSSYCNYDEIMQTSAEGAGLAFVVFTEAILQFPASPVWSVLFFLMLLMLGLGSMFGTLEGVITSLNDSHLVALSKPVLTGILCLVSTIIGLIFTTRSGQYWVSLFDQFAGSYSLTVVVLFEIVAVIYVYGWSRFAKDIEAMTGEKLSSYWTITWRFFAPAIMIGLLFSSVVDITRKLPSYYAYDKETTRQVDTQYPPWALFIAFLMVFFTILPVPAVLFVRFMKLFHCDPDIPKAQRIIHSTTSTSIMLKSPSSLYQIDESELQSMELGGRMLR